MAPSAPPPIFTFRGHTAGVTALIFRKPSTLFSADEEGNIISWNSDTFKQIATWMNVCQSKILSIRIVQIDQTKGGNTDVLVIQSRNDGIYLNDVVTLQNITNYPSYQSLFSRGDAISHGSETVLAYPSAIESNLVTVRFLGRDTTTLISGSTTRRDGEKDRRESSVFDIVIKPTNSDNFHLFVAYEDGNIIVYNLNKTVVETIPELNVTGLKIEVLHKFEFGLTDFVSSFDVFRRSSGLYEIVCGSPKKELMFSVWPIDSETRMATTQCIVMKKPGTSAIKIRDDCKLAAVACWDNSIRIFSMKSHRHLATIKDHMKQVSDIIFVSTDEPVLRTLMISSSLDGTISVFDIYN